mgnify:CR=1 FL=1
MREKSEDFEYTIRFSIAFVVVEIFRCKDKQFFTSFYRFFDILGTFEPPDFTPFLQHYFYRCRLMLSNQICSYKLIAVGKHV